ncbi:MAG TPA: PAS domain S-box protein [Gaiellaceae bacterium]|nr:PAS domain S-box protein [Gaiellaceae bacterium]
MPGIETHAREQILAAAIDDAPTCVFVANAEMRYVAVNRYACELLGYTEAELLEMHVSDVARYEHAPSEYAQMIDSAYRTGVSRIVCKDGEELLLHYVAGPCFVLGETFYVSVGRVDFEASPQRS